MLHKVHLVHFAGFDLVNDVNVWLHGLVVTVSSPFHDDARRDALGESVDDECPSSGMCSNQLPFLCDLINSFVPFVSGRSDFFVNFCQLAQFLQVSVHGLVGVERKHEVASLIRDSAILLYDLLSFECKTL